VIGLRIEPPVVADDMSRVVTVQMTNGDAAPLTNVVVGLDVPPSSVSSRAAPASNCRSSLPVPSTSTL
jgi:hypothetical protein